MLSLNSGEADLSLIVRVALRRIWLLHSELYLHHWKLTMCEAVDLSSSGNCNWLPANKTPLRVTRELKIKIEAWGSIPYLVKNMSDLSRPLSVQLCNLALFKVEITACMCPKRFCLQEAKTAASALLHESWLTSVVALHCFLLTKQFKWLWRILWFLTHLFW